VIHSLYVPAFRIKQDIVPGINNKMWFIANDTGKYDILCAEYCGQGHSAMLSKVVVLTESDYNKWLDEKATSNGVEMSKGEQLLTTNGCLGCHSRDGSKIIGPSFKGLFGSTRSVFDESGNLAEVKADSTYIKHSIYEPNAQVVQGFNKGLMVSYKTTLRDADVDEIIKYMETLK
jgi:cytochrome c oxidase subunit 2